MWNVIWKRLETKIDAAITRRLLVFYEAMIRRGQIPAKSENLPPAH